MIDTEVRNRVIQNHDTLMAVEAGAGTGKTSLLTAKYIDLVRTERARPHEIVAMTFTEKAAAELRDRIRRELEKEGRRDQMDELDRAPILTIHSFAASLLRERPLEAGIEPNFQQLDGVGATLFLRRMYEKWLPTAIEAQRAPLMRALAVGFSLDVVRTVALKLYHHRDLLGAIPPPTPEEGAWETFEKEIQDLRIFGEKNCASPQDAGYATILRLASEADHFRDAPPAVAERSLLTRFEFAAGKGAQKNWATPDHAREFKARMADLKIRLDAFVGARRQSLFYEFLKWASSFVDFVEAEKRKEGKLDFDDLLMLSRNLLASHEEVADYFRRKFRYFLVDEFQDTDPIQAEIIWRLCAKQGGQRWQELPLEPGKLVLVGDPKQSIYRFRRADIDLYRASTGELARQGERLVISQNFRSSAAILEWVNAIFAPILGELYEPITAHPDHPPTRDRPVILLESPEAPEELNAEENRRLEAEGIAALLRELLDSPHSQIVDRKTMRTRRLVPGDIAILFPVTTKIDLYEEALRDYGIPFTLEGGHLFFQRQEVHGLLATLEAIDRPADSLAVVSALHSIFFGLSDQELLAIHAVEPSFDYRRMDPEKLEEPSATAIRHLQRFHALAPELPPSKLIFRLMEETALIPITLARRHGEQAAANLEKLLSMARALEQSGEASLNLFVRWARDRAKEGDEQSESPLSASEESDHVRLLTIHRSKGLEFPVVVWANFGGTRDTSENVIADRLAATLDLRWKASGVPFGTRSFEAAAEREKERRTKERKRLLYVAATRTRDLLIIPKFIGDHQSAALWKLLDPHWALGESRVEVRAFDTLKRIDRTRTREERPKHQRSLQDWERESLAPLATRSSAWLRGLPLRTATELVHSQDLQDQPPRSNRDFGSSPGTTVGSLFHRTLEISDFDPTHAGIYAKAAAKESGEETLIPEITDLAARALQNPLFDRVRKAEKMYRELPFSYQEGGFLYEGSVDLLFEEPDGLVIVDYKTDRLKSGEIPRRAEHYAPQLQLYARALASLSKKPIKETLLFFVRSQQAVQVR